MRFWPILLTCPLLSGCLAFGYPSITHTPEVAVPDADVRAFLVTSEIKDCAGIGGAIQIQDGKSVKEIPVANASVASQQNAYFAYSYLVFPILAGSRSRSQEVLLYRPGYETVVVQARPWWQSVGSERNVQVNWKVAPDLLAQKEAVDKVANQVWIGGFSQMFKASLSREVAQFATQECARLAESPLAADPALEIVRKQLITLAKEIHERVEK